MKRNVKRGTPKLCKLSKDASCPDFSAEPGIVRIPDYAIVAFWQDWAFGLRRHSRARVVPVLQRRLAPGLDLCSSFDAITPEEEH